MNYKNIYKNLINRARNRSLEEYTERHHIIPRCIGGNNNADNIVSLTPEEHYVAHQLLVKMYKKRTIERYKLIKAVNMMSTGKSRMSNKKYGWIRREYSKSVTGKGNPMFGRIAWNKGLIGEESHCFGRENTKETKEKMRESRLRVLKENTEELNRMKDMAKNRTKEHQEKINEANRGQKRTLEQRRNISDAHKGKMMNEGNPKSKRCSVYDIVYPSVREAHRQTNISLNVIYGRIKNPDNEDFYYL